MYDDYCQSTFATVYQNRLVGCGGYIYYRFPGHGFSFLDLEPFHRGRVDNQLVNLVVLRMKQLNNLDLYRYRNKRVV